MGTGGVVIGVVCVMTLFPNPSDGQNKQTGLPGPLPHPIIEPGGCAGGAFIWRVTHPRHYCSVPSPSPLLCGLPKDFG